ncbi:MAG: hypothetical protein K6D91_09820 [Prevotella sp.]|nr:hypothetical protein [Prevotella sp.]
MKSGFARFLTSGFYTEVTALKALGWTIFIFLLGFFIVYWIIKGIIRLFSKKDKTPEE